MVEVRDNDCVNQLVITLCEVATQTDVPETTSVGAGPNTPPALQEGASQTPLITYTETATQMTPPIKETFVELAPQIVPEVVPVTIPETFTTLTTLNACSKYIKRERSYSIEIADELSEDHNIKNETSLIVPEDEEVCEVEKVEEDKKEVVSVASDQKEEAQIKL